MRSLKSHYESAHAINAQRCETRRLATMSVRVQPSRINVMDHSGKDHLLAVVRQARTACTEWQVRDVAAHMVDVTEAYLQRWALARGGQSIGSAIGVQDVMPHRLDAAAKKLREVPQQELIARLK